MATDKSENQDSGSAQGDAASNSMKERLLAQRRADAAKAGAPPVPASKPASANPAGSASAAARPAATPGAAAARPATPAAPAAGAARPAPARPAPAPAKPAMAAPAAPEPEEKRPVKLRAQRADELEERANARRGSKSVSPEVLREVEMLRKQQDKWITYGWIVAGVLLAIAGVVFFVVTGKKKAYEDAIAAQEKVVNDFMSTFDKLDITKETDAKEVLKLAEENKTIWTTTDMPGVKAKVAQKIGQATNSLERLKELKELQEGLATVKKAAANAASLKPEELAQVRRNLLNYEQKGGEIGTEFIADVAATKLLVNRVYAERLHEDAKQAAAKGPSEARAALTVYTKAEDEVQALLNEATNRHMKDAADFYAGHYRDMIKEADVLVGQLFTPEAIEKEHWLDLLNGEQVKNWAQAGFKGFEVKDGVLHAVAKDPGARETGVASIGDREAWRDYVVEIEFVIVKGNFNILYRLGKAVNNTTYGINPSSTGNDAFKAGQPYTATATVIGSHIKIVYSDPDKNPRDDDLSWTIVRRGAVGISVPEGSEVKLTKMRIKVMR